MRSETREILEVAMVGCYIYKPLFSSDIFNIVVYAIMILMSEHTHNMHIRGNEGRGGGAITKIRCFCEHYNGPLFYFITHSFLILACFCVGIVYIPIQNMIFLCSYVTKKTLQETCRSWYKKSKMVGIRYQQKHYIEQVIIYLL